MEHSPRTVLVTGACGYIGRLAVEALATERDTDGTPRFAVVASDIRPPNPGERFDGVRYETADVRSPDLNDLFARVGADVVVHLAAIVTPGRNSDRELEHAVDVLGTRNVLDACVTTGVRQIVITSSGAAYGYHADNPSWLTETDALRGNVEFAYSDHKRQVEQMLARYRDEHPLLRQLVFRPGTVLGETTRNQITDLFDGAAVVGLRGASTPFVLIWDRDVAACIVRGVVEGRSGIYNLAGDGVLTLREMAAMMGKPYLAIPVPLVRGALAVMKRLGRTQYGPEQVDFLRYRPVLNNLRLRTEFGYIPRKTTREVFELFVEARRRAS